MKWALMPYGFTGCECARYAARGLAIGLAAATAVAWALHQATALARFLFCVLSSYPCMKARFLTLNAIRFARGFRRQWGRRIAVLRLFGVYRRGRGKGGL